MVPSSEASQGPGARVSFRNRNEIRQKDPKLYEALSDLDRATANVADQTNTNRKGQPLPPPAIDGLSVTGQNGHFNLQITHKGDFYRGIKYYAEYADNPGFSNPYPIELGASRSRNVFLGNATLYWRAYAAYSSSAPGPAAYHGGAGSPQPVEGGGSVGPPAFLPSQGSGTGNPGEGLAGPGLTPFRSQDGKPPVRGKDRVPGGSGAAGGSLPPGPATGLPEGASSTFAGGGGGGGTVSTTAIYDTYANWTTAKYDPAQLSVNTQFFITDRNFVEYVVRVVGGANKWVYQAGTYGLAQAGIAGLKGFNGAVLGTNDNGLLIEVTDYAHVLKWSGTAWGWGPGESGSGYFQDFAVAPTGTGWHACDGSAGVAYLKADGTTGTVTLPNTTGSAAYRKNGAAYASAITPATVPTISGKTETAPTGVTVGNNNANENFNFTGGGVSLTVAKDPHQHSVSDPQHYHDLTAANAPISLPGDPIARYQAMAYFRI